MNIKEFFDSLFKKKSIVQDTLSLLDVNKLVKIPTRKKYKSQKLYIDKIDEYKNEYKKSLSSSNTITSIELHSIELKEQMDTYINILINSYFKNGGISTLEIVDEETILFSKINYLKLKMYKEDLEKLQTEIELRLIALNELSWQIANSKSNNKVALENEINNLVYSYYIYSFQRAAIDCEIDSYKKIVCSRDVNLKNYNEMVTAKLKRIKHYMLVLMPEKTDIMKSIINQEALLTFCEYYLELFAHDKKNIDKAKSLILEMLSKPDVVVNDYESEPLIRTIYDFNAGEISDEEIYNFYQVKYDMLSFNMSKTSPFMKVYDRHRDNVECTIYEDIAQKKIEKIVNGDISPIFKNSEVYLGLLEILKTNKLYDVDAILTNPILLRFLNLCSKVPLSYQEVRVYFDSVMIDVKKDFSLWNHKNGLVLTSKISIRCMEFLAYDINPSVEKNIILSICADENIENNLKYKLYKFYTHLAPEVRTFSGQIPDGIRMIGKPGSREHALVWANIKNKLRDQSYISLPNTMEEFGTNILLGQDLNVLELNEGLSRLYTEQDSIIKIGLSVRHLYIPSTLENMDWHYFKDESFDYITITNFKESKILKNKKLMRTLLAKCCVIHAEDKDAIKCAGGRLENPVIESRISFILTDENDRSYRYLIKTLGHPDNWTEHYIEGERAGYIRYARYQDEVNKIVDLFYQKVEELIGYKLDDKKAKVKCKKKTE